MGKEYDAAKKQLVWHEQLLLRSLHFDIAIQHPYKYLLNYCNLFKASSSVCQRALCLVNDSLSLTQLCLTQQPAAVAAGALWLAVKAGGMQSSPSQWPANWTEVIGIPDASLQDVLAELRHCII